MMTLFLVCAVAGGAVMVCQLALTLMGFAGGHDVDHPLDTAGSHGGAGHVDHGSTWFFNVLSFRALVAALTFFGLGGMVCTSTPGLAIFAFPAGLVTGFAAMLLVAWLMSTLSALQAEGTVYVENALGAAGTVYLTIPPKGKGTGKIMVKVQNRTMEYKATNTGETPLATGTPVEVVGITGPDTVEVGPVVD